VVPLLDSKKNPPCPIQSGALPLPFICPTYLYPAHFVQLPLNSGNSRIWGGTKGPVTIQQTKNFTVWVFLGGAPGMYTWSPLLRMCASINFLWEHLGPLKPMFFFNRAPNWGLKKLLFGPWAATHNKIIDAHIKKRAKRGVSPSFR